MSPRKDELAILAAMFLDLLGFGMLVADIQFRGERLMPRGWPAGPIIGLLLASTFVVQLFASPRWGRISDRRGRKPVVVACTLLSAAAMAMYGIAGSLWILFLSRILSGLGAANVAVAQAFVSERYEGETRTAALGRVGAAISTGLVVGPLLGGLLAHVGKIWLSQGPLPPQFLLGTVGAVASLGGAFGLWMALPNEPPREHQEPGRQPAIDLRLLRDLPEIRPLIVIATVAWLSLATLEGTFGRLIERLFGYDQRQFGLLFGYESLLAIVVQGVLLGWMAKRIRETPLLRGSYLAQGVGLALNPAAAVLASVLPPMVTLFVASTLYAVGSGVANPTVNSLCSRLVPVERQGELFGLLQGTRSLGFVLGPIVGGTLFDWHPAIPYVLAGIVCLGAAILVPSIHPASERPNEEP